MKNAALTIVRGGGNVFRDLRKKSPDVSQCKAVLAAEIIKILDRDYLTTRGAHSRTGIATDDISRIRSADLGRFTIGGLISILNRLGFRVEVKVRIEANETSHRRGIPEFKPFRFAKPLSDAFIRKARKEGRA